MNKRRHKTFTLLFGGFFAISLLVNIAQIVLHDPKSFFEMFNTFKAVGLLWIPYLSLAAILLSGLGAMGLMKYRQWGFYSIYLSYLAGVLIVWFPFFPGFMFQFGTGLYTNAIMLIALFAVLIVLIYLHVSGRKGYYFWKSVQNVREAKP
jgi:hypothetical protein